MRTGIRQIALTAIGMFCVVIMSGCPARPTGDQAGGADGKGAEKTISPSTLTYETLEGVNLNLGEAAAGKPLFITFFAGWCAVCAEETPEINRIYEKYAAVDAIALYAVNIGDSKKKVEEMISKRGIKYSVLMDEKMKSQDIFNILGLPLNVVYDRNGNEIYRAAEIPGEEIFAKALAR